MKHKLVWEAAGLRTFVLVLDPGEEAVAAIKGFAGAQGLSGASLTALGAFEHATVAWFDVEAKQYRPIEVASQCEGLSLLGDVARDDQGGVALHIHAVLGLADGTTRGGHLLRATVRPTLEVTLVETPAHLRRTLRPELGVALIDLDAG
jgi:hypothetical protein